MHASPEVSIIVPAHNAERFLRSTLDSIRSQSFDAWECVIVDDGSSDSTAVIAAEVLSLDSRFRLVRQSCGGPSRARNRGFLESLPSTRFVSFMDSDDLWEAGALESLVRALNSDPEVVGVHGLAELIDDRGRPLVPGNFSSFGRRRLGLRGERIVDWPLNEPTVFATLAWTGPLHPPGLLLARREVYEKVGLYDPELRLCEDWDMCLRLSRAGDIKFIDEVILRYRRHAANLSQNVGENRRAVRQLHAKTYFSKYNSPEQRQQLRWGWRAWQLFKIREKWDAVKSGCGGCGGSPLKRAIALLEISAHFVRYLRGYPRAKGI